MNGTDPGAPKVQLGCGTLILIALIVMFFSGAGKDRALRKEIRELRQTVDRLERKIDALQKVQPATATTPATTTR